VANSVNQTVAVPRLFVWKMLRTVCSVTLSCRWVNYAYSCSGSDGIIVSD